MRSATSSEREAYETRREREALDRLAEGVGRGARGVGGLAGTLAALNEARVETLLIAGGFAAPGVRDPSTSAALSGDDAPGDRELEPLPDVVETAIEKALDQSAEVLAHPRPRRPRAARRHRRRSCGTERAHRAVLGHRHDGRPDGAQPRDGRPRRRAWNRTRERAEPLTADGIEVAGDAAAAVRGADVVVTMSPTATRSPRSSTPALGEFDGAVWAQMSTVGVAGLERLVALAADAGVALVDAPVSGTRQPAEQGTLVVLASVPPRRASAARPCSTRSAPRPSCSATSRVPPRT